MFRWYARLYYWLAERLYHEFAWFYDCASWLVSLGKWDTWRKCALDYIEGQRILEIGFGTGELLSEMARRDLHVVGLDSSLQMHRITAKKYYRSGLHVPRILAKAGQVPFAEGTFDTIISTFPSGYIFEPDTWREIARLLHSDNSVLNSTFGRFVVVGLYATRRGRRILPGAAEAEKQVQVEVLARIKSLAANAGLELCVVIRSFPGVNLPIVIATKLHGKIQRSI